MCIYILHSLKTKWLPIMEQTKIFVCFKTATITPIMLNLIRDQSTQINKSANRTSRKNWSYQVYMNIVQRGYFKAHFLEVFALRGDCLSRVGFPLVICCQEGHPNCKINFVHF